MVRSHMVSVHRLKRMERRGYARFTPTFWHEAYLSGKKRLTLYLLAEIRKFEHAAMIPLPIKKMPGGYFFFAAEDQMTVLRGYEDAKRQLAHARAIRI